MKNFIAIVIYCLLAALVFKTKIGVLPTLMALFGNILPSVGIAYTIDDYVKEQNGKTKK